MVAWLPICFYVWPGKKMHCETQVNLVELNARRVEEEKTRFADLMGADNHRKRWIANGDTHYTPSRSQKISHSLFFLLPLIRRKIQPFIEIVRGHWKYLTTRSIGLDDLFICLFLKDVLSFTTNKLYHFYVNDMQT